MVEYPDSADMLDKIDARFDPDEFEAGCDDHHA
jgi:hypothetical protein